jgi:hypothetical protein
MKIQVTDYRVFPTLGILAEPGDEVEVPDDAFAPVVVTSTKKSAPAAKEVNDDGSAPF